MDLACAHVSLRIIITGAGLPTAFDAVAGATRAARQRQELADFVPEVERHAISIRDDGLTPRLLPLLVQLDDRGPQLQWSLCFSTLCHWRPVPGCHTG